MNVPSPGHVALAGLVALIWPAIDYVRWHRRGFLHH